MILSVNFLEVSGKDLQKNDFFIPQGFQFSPYQQIILHKICKKVSKKFGNSKKMTNFATAIRGL